jgi:hypothetical protein
MGEPAAARRGPGHRRHPERRTAQPGHQRRCTAALGRRAGRPLPRHRRRRGLHPRTRRPPAAPCRPAAAFRGTEGIEVWSDRVEPHSPGLRSRMWYGVGSVSSARRAGEAGMNLLASNVVKAGGAEATGFAEIQRSHIAAFRAAHPSGRASQGLVVIPTDSATTGQRSRYEAYAQPGCPAPRPRRVRPGCCSRPISSGEGRAADPPGRRVQPHRARRPLRRGAGHRREIRGRDRRPHPVLGHHLVRPDSRRVESGDELVDADPATAARAGPRRPGAGRDRVDRPDPARHRDAEADGRGPRLAAAAAGMERPARTEQGPAGLGEPTAIRNGAGSPSARPTRPSRRPACTPPSVPTRRARGRPGT